MLGFKPTKSTGPLYFWPPVFNLALAAHPSTWLVIFRNVYINVQCVLIILPTYTTRSTEANQWSSTFRKACILSHNAVLRIRIRMDPHHEIGSDQHQSQKSGPESHHFDQRPNSWSLTVTGGIKLTYGIRLSTLSPHSGTMNLATDVQHCRTAYL